MPLSISYSHALSDPTYCDAGKESGLAITKQFNLKPNEPLLLSKVLPHVTVAQLLWCLRVVKPSLKVEADNVAWQFMSRVLATPNNALWPIFKRDVERYIAFRIASSKAPKDRKALLEYATALYGKTVREQDTQECQALMAVLQDASPSQIAIDVSDRMIKARAFDNNGYLEEAYQRKILQDLLDE